MKEKIIRYLRLDQLSWLKQLIKYGLVGVINTLISLSIIFLVMNGLKFSYVIANGVGYSLGFINSFIMNKIWTFQSKDNILREISRFVAVFLVCYMIQLGFLSLLIEKLHMTKEVATLVAMVLYTGLNFIGNKWVTFRDGAKSQIQAK